MDDRIDEQRVADALARRGASADGNVRGALRRLATGLLRQFHTGASDPIMDPVKQALGVDEKTDCAQQTVDWYLVGRRDMPPFPERPQMRPAIAGLFEDTMDRAATSEELDVLLNTLVGVERDVVLSPGPLARMRIAAKLVEAFALGAD